MKDLRLNLIQEAFVDRKYSAPSKCCCVIKCLLYDRKSCFICLCFISFFLSACQLFLALDHSLKALQFGSSLAECGKLSSRFDASPSEIEHETLDWQDVVLMSAYKRTRINLPCLYGSGSVIVPSAGEFLFGQTPAKKALHNHSTSHFSPERQTCEPATRFCLKTNHTLLQCQEVLPCSQRPEPSLE